MMGRYQRRHPSRRVTALPLLLLILAGCAQDQQPTAFAVSQDSEQQHQCAESPDTNLQSASVELTKEETEEPSAQTDPLTTSHAAHGRSTKECYHLQPCVSKKTKKKGGRCEPQSLPFARCRSGIMSCGLGWNNGPLTWFACEKKRGNTSSIPAPGSVLILDCIRRHKMPTGHVAYIEKVVAENDHQYQIIFSHTNYDRRCTLETDIKARYNSATKTLDIDSGAWKDWGKGLPVAGFILR